METAFTIVTLLVFLSSLQTTESRSNPFQNRNSIREQAGNQPDEEECALRRPDGTCQNRLDMVQKRQAKCNRRKSPNCRVMIGKKRAPHNIDCSQLEGRRSLFCRTQYFKRLNPNTPCDKRSEKCENLNMHGSDFRTKEIKRCDKKSPFCYVPFPGKRKPKHSKDLKKRTSRDETGSRFSMLPETTEAEVEEVDHKDTVTVAENDLLGELLVRRGTTKLPYELSESEEQKANLAPTVAEDSDNSKPTCDPKRDFQCRFRIFGGKRDQVFNKPTYPKSYKYN